MVRLPRRFVWSAVMAMIVLAAPARAESLYVPNVGAGGGVWVSGARPQPVTPYGPGFDRGVIVGGPGAGDNVNRPYENQQYRHYFDVPQPRYDTALPRHSTRRLAVPQAATGNADWCAGRYRSYRASDNTYQPLHGPRRPCTPPL